MFLFLLACTQSKPLRSQLANALSEENIEKVRQIVDEVKSKLGDKAGIPEVDDSFREIPVNENFLDSLEIMKGFTEYNIKIQKFRWWRINIDPTKLDHFLREPASVITGCCYSYKNNLYDCETSLELAKEAAQFLIWAQQKAKTGVYPFPAVRNITKDDAFIAAEKFLTEAEKRGELENIVNNGWIIEDLGDGGLQFDNGEAGDAMFRLYEITKDTVYLNSALKSANWAISRPLVPNWNYNSFSVFLLAKAYQITRKQKYLDSALKKALIGVLPGQLKDGQRIGRWVDPHNAKPSYHYIMMRSLVQLISVMPKLHKDRPTILNALKLGLKARNIDFISRGAPNKNSALYTLIEVNKIFINEKKFLKETYSDKALDALIKLVSFEYRQGKLPVGPSEWGMTLDYLIWRKSNLLSE